MDIERNKAVAVSFLEIISGARAGNAEDLVVDGATWWQNGGGERTIAEVLASLATGLRARAVGPMEGSLGTLTAEADRVAIETRGRMPLSGGEVYDNSAYLLFTLRGELIASIREYGDTALIARLFG